MSYNGWENYETWRAYEYLDDVDWQNFAENKLFGEEEITEDKKTEILALYLKDLIEREVDMADVNSFLKDLLAKAISEIDFTDLATVFLDV
jgi:predicted house-cleaning noncanonical NTP pyrophosphatase (MazG superfamily)